MTTIRNSLTIASFAAVALIGVTASLVHNLPDSDPVWRAPVMVAHNHIAPSIATAQRFESGSEGADQVGALSASEINRCIMPRAWQRHCQASAIKVAAR